MLHARQRTAGFFLGDRESEARHSRLLLLRAGDIEENPGPNHCGWCKDLVKEANYLSCKNCETKFHMKRFCSGLSRNDARTTARDNTLLCFMCARREWLECALCSSKFHNSQKGNKCCDCGNSYHYKCAKVLRSQQGSKDWKCPPCKGEHLSQPQQPSNLEQATCATCAELTGTNAQPAATKDTSSAAVEGDKIGSAECATRANHSNHLAYGRTKTHSPQANVRNVQAESTRERRGQRVDSAPNISTTSAQAAHEAAKNMRTRKTGTVMPAKLPRSPPQYRTSKERRSRRIRHRIS